MSQSLADQSVAEACRQTGLDDFGSDSFREGLEIYCDSVLTEAQLNEVGNAALPATIVAALANRLKVVDWTTRYPAVTEERIDEPFVVIGMFRAGTTFLSHLLDRTPANRALLRWEAGDSVPPPTPRDVAHRTAGRGRPRSATRCSRSSTRRSRRSITRNPTGRPSASR